MVRRALGGRLGDLCGDSLVGLAGHSLSELHDGGLALRQRVHRGGSADYGGSGYEAL